MYAARDDEGRIRRERGRVREDEQPVREVDELGLDEQIRHRIGPPTMIQPENPDELEIRVRPGRIDLDVLILLARRGGFPPDHELEATVRVRWPGGFEQRLPPPADSRYITLRSRQ